MSSELLYKMVVVDGDKEILSKNLSYSSVAAILMNLPDLAEYGDLYTVAAKHPSKQVRALVAQKETISAALCNVLANDASIDVLRCLTSNAPFRENATIELLEGLIERDVEIATEIAGNIEAYQRVDANKLAALISGHSDPEVLAALASYGSGAPTKALNALLTHPDPAVSNAAKSSLQDRGSE